MINIDTEKEIILYVKNKSNGMKWDKLPLNYVEYLKQRFTDNRTDSIKESYYRILYSIDTVPKCEICGKAALYVGKYNFIYGTTCGCKECRKTIRQIKSKQTKLDRYGDPNYNNNNKSKETLFKKYGVTASFNIPHVRENMIKSHHKNRNEITKKIRNTCMKRYGVINGGGSKQSLEKIRNTCLERYGVTSSFLIPNVKEKIQQIKLERWGDKHFTNINKAKKTFLKRYGFENPAQSDIIKSKIKKTCLEKYGVDHPWKIIDIHNKCHSKESKEKIKSTCLERYGVDCIQKTQMWKDHVNATKRKNNIFNSSKYEDNIFTALNEKFNDIKRQYKTKEYPFNCDFYIPKLNLYIECNFHWTHGGKPFNADDIDCKQKLNTWIEKSSTSNFYKNAINTWTVRDVKKREIAKVNKLNYIEFWNKKEIESWLNSV